MFRRLIISVLFLFSASIAKSQTAQPLSVPPDSPRWDLEGEAKPAEYQGRKALLIDGGAAVLKDFEMRDAVIDVDVATPAPAVSSASTFELIPTAKIMKKSIFASTSPAIPMPCNTRPS